MVSLQAAVAILALSGHGQTVLLDFYTDQCGYCREMEPTVQGLIAKGYRVERVNAEKNRVLATKYKVSTLPCFIMFVDGQEVDRAVGKTSFSRLEHMCRMGKAAPSPGQSPVLLAQHTVPVAPTPTPPASSALASPFDGWGTPGPTNPPASQGVQPVSDAALLAASVRLRVEDPNGHSCGSGTIVDTRGGKAMIVTCGHIFRDSGGKGRIEVDLFGPSGSQRVEGKIESYDADGRDIGLVWINVPGPVKIARIAPPGYRVDPGMVVATVGCNNGDPPTVQRSKITSLDRFQGPPNIQVAGQPVEGRSGGGLFSPEGYLIGVCNAADPSDKEGYFAALGSIYAELDRADRKFVYQSPSEDSGVLPVGAAPAALAAAPIPTMPAAMPGTADAGAPGFLPPSEGAMPAALPPQEQVVLDEMHRRLKEGCQVTIVVSPPSGKNEVYTLDHASSAFTRQIAAESRRQDDLYKTSFEVPKANPHKILLEWSAPKGVLANKSVGPVMSDPLPATTIRR